jgi:hypothetical protein
MHVGTFAQETRTVLFAGEGKGLRYAVRQVAVARDGRMAAAAVEGLFVRSKGAAWSRVFPQDGARSWAPVDVRGVAFEAKDRMWFASPQGVGVLDGARWRLFTGAEGLPYNDFTTAAAAETAPFGSARTRG